MSLNTSWIEKTPKLCLNMIVKNESKIILRMLDSVFSLIDSYCICDTGSTDNTMELIQTYFQNKHIPGKIVQEPFQNFGYNRSFALQQCVGMENADYILLMDADMTLRWNEKEIEKIKKSLLETTAYYVFQGCETFYYKNVRIVKNNCGMKYWGVTHEYVEVPENTVYGIIPREHLFITDIGDGGSKTDKFTRDIRLLIQGLEEKPNNARYTFYLANSYRDNGEKEKAIETYKKRIEIGEWMEEVWFSNFMIGRIYKNMNDMERAIYYWLEAFHIFPNRIENLYEIINYYRIKGKNQLAYTFYSLAKQQITKFPNWDYLFLEKDIYDFKLDYELSIIGYYYNENQYNLMLCCMKLFSNSLLEEWMFRNILSNYKFYSKTIEYQYSSSQSSFPHYHLLEIGKDLDILGNTKGFVSSTPSICIHNNELLVNLRYVNYSINEKGEYINKENIETINVLYQENQHNNNNSERILDYDTQYNNVYIGLEDVKLFSHKNKLYYNANRGLSHHHIVVEHGEIDIISGKTINSILLKGKQQNAIEKNWVLFENAFGQMKCIYQWYPLTIGSIINSHDYTHEINYIVTNEIKTNRLFKYIRGSTNGVIVKNEIWFIGHVVSYEDRRYYYHIFIAMDTKTYEVKRYTPLFTFEKEKVEYTLGFTYDEKQEQLMIGYSIMDKYTKYMIVNTSTVDAMFLSI